jgi:hypothetical protein
MYMNSDRIGQLATAHHHEMLADARRRQLRQQARPACGTPDTTSTVTRRLGSAIAKAGAAMARVPSAIRPARPQSLSETPVAR